MEAIGWFLSCSAHHMIHRQRMRPVIFILLSCLACCSRSRGVTLTPLTHNPRCYQSLNSTSLMSNSSAGLCTNLTVPLCLNTRLSFTHTSVDLAGDSATLDEVYRKLELWSGLQNVPQCWAVVQPFLCSVYLPK